MWSRKSSCGFGDFKLFSISEQQLTDIADELKSYTANAMKIDMAPWATGYTEIDMDNLYTELTLESVENQAIRNTL